MNKRLLIGMAAVIALAIGVTVKTVSQQNDSLVRMNLEILADQEVGGPYGSIDCAGWANDCMVRCPQCGANAYSRLGLRGPAIAYHCYCGWSL